MFSWFEKRGNISWTFTLLIALTIFYISTITFPPGKPGGIGLNAILYHILVFFFFSLFLFISLVRGRKIRLFAVGTFVAFLYGISDEVHQIFVPGRFFAYADIGYDTLGILYALMFYAISILYRNKLN